ncbi:phosphatase PAP2 family protein [Nocardiopsis ansamitocini]|uniref:Phosphatidic acid phosphatase type 2/haloperoxidase domain-containing protein n=1 Tax=Nocardiopsis ansamitocini TaxID=1670832 RepID=A0A9W6P941_9ACTN|nr:phosphatase PAP2 family protein [Nocardiopsis ansamitocini]GLU49252.1 hypothetical protein Nans01_36030 [Nocardiopsis ansamitocini]
MTLDSADFDSTVRRRSSRRGYEDDHDSEPRARTHESGSPLPTNRAVLGLTVAVALVPFLALSALVTGGWSPLLTADATIAERLYERVHPDPAFAHGLEIWTELFGTWAMRIVSLLAAAWLVFRRQFATAAWACAAVFTANLLGLVVKLTVDRARPEFADPILVGVGPSFPSGHALMATTGMGIALFAALPLLRGAMRHVACWVAIGIAMSTALSRPMLGVHWFSDIFAGVSLGIVALALTMLAWTYLPPVARRWDRESANWR